MLCGEDAPRRAVTNFSTSKKWKQARNAEREGLIDKVDGTRRRKLAGSFVTVPYLNLIFYSVVS